MGPGFTGPGFTDLAVTGACVTGPCAEAGRVVTVHKLRHPPGQNGSRVFH